MDFTISIYKELLSSLLESGYKFKTLSDFFIEHDDFEKIIIIRNDIDLLPQSALIFANIQAEMGIKSSFYFRSIDESWDENIINKINFLGHEIGYHYENMDTANGNIDLAWKDFNKNLKRFKKLAEIKTICMHGSPKSKYDNREIWLKYDYKELGIIAEPYYDINFDDFFYLTDTGRKWDGWKSSVRDKVPQQKEWIKRGLVFHSTKDIINTNEQGLLPSKILFNFHPQRWHEKKIPWFKELILQSIKNQIKKLIISNS